MANLTQLFHGQHRNILLLYVIGNPIGYIVGYLSKALTSFLPQMDFLSNKISDALLLGFAIGLSVQIVSMLAILVWTSWKSQLYVPVTWLLLGVSSGVLVSLTAFSGILVSTGFILPYIIVLLLPFLVVFLVGVDAIRFLVVDAAKLVASYAAITTLNVLITWIAA